MEISIYQSESNHLYCPYQHKTTAKAELTSKQKEIVITQLKVKCVGCFNNPTDCKGMGGFNEDNQLVDNSGDVVSVEYCPAIAIPVEV